MTNMVPYNKQILTWLNSHYSSILHFPMIRVKQIQVSEKILDSCRLGKYIQSIGWGKLQSYETFQAHIYDRWQELKMHWDISRGCYWQTNQSMIPYGMPRLHWVNTICWEVAKGSTIERQIFTMKAWQYNEVCFFPIQSLGAVSI